MLSSRTILKLSIISRRVSNLKDANLERDHVIFHPTRIGGLPLSADLKIRSSRILTPLEILMVDMQGSTTAAIQPQLGFQLGEAMQRQSGSQDLGESNVRCATYNTGKDILQLPMTRAKCSRHLDPTWWLNEL
jgi:hypothetical protein